MANGGHPKPDTTPKPEGPRPAGGEKETKEEGTAQR